MCYRKWDDLDGFLQRIDTPTTSISATTYGGGSSNNDSSIRDSNRDSDREKKHIRRLVSVLPEDKFQVLGDSHPPSPSIPLNPSPSVI